MAFPEPADQYLRTFTWNKVKYRADKPLVELIDSLQKVGVATAGMDLLLKSFLQELVSIDNDVKSKFSQYNTVKTNLSTLQRRQTCVLEPIIGELKNNTDLRKWEPIYEVSNSGRRPFAVDSRLRISRNTPHCCSE
jgi:hypothetical protein